jgi:hypothetical protein
VVVPTQPDYRVVSLGTAAPLARRTLGPTAWVVLEYLVGSAEDGVSGTVSHQSVRGIADALGLAKDTVARALHRLSDEGLATHVPNRAHDGRFGHSHYRLILPPDLFVDFSMIRPTEPRPPTVSTRKRVAADAQQLSLIDTASSGT